MGVGMGMAGGAGKAGIMQVLASLVESLKERWGGGAGGEGGEGGASMEATIADRLPGLRERPGMVDPRAGLPTGQPRVGSGNVIMLPPETSKAAQTIAALGDLFQGISSMAEKSREKSNPFKGLFGGGG